MTEDYQRLKEDAVVSVADEDKYPAANKTFKVEEFLENFKSQIRHRFTKWIDDGDAPVLGQYPPNQNKQVCQTNMFQLFR